MGGDFLSLVDEKGYNPRHTTALNTLLNLYPSYCRLHPPGWDEFLNLSLPAPLIFNEGEEEEAAIHLRLNYVSYVESNYHKTVRWLTKKGPLSVKSNYGAKLLEISKALVAHQIAPSEWLNNRFNYFAATSTARKAPPIEILLSVTALDKLRSLVRQERANMTGLRITTPHMQDMWDKNSRFLAMSSMLAPLSEATIRELYFEFFPPGSIKKTIQAGNTEILDSQVYLVAARKRGDWIWS